MAFAYGQNMTELGRNIIDLEQLRNSRDAQQAQAQNQFLAQLNQAALGRQQIAAQAQAQQNAMMAQAIQQRQYQGNLDRDFGLRQNAQTNQAQQFKDALDFDRKKLEVNPYSASTQNTIARANEERMYRNELAKGKAAEAKSAWTQLLKDYDAEKLAIVKATPSAWKPWFVDNWNIGDKLTAAEKVHQKARGDFMAGLGKFREVLNITEDPSDPYKTRFEPILLSPIDISGIGQPGNTLPVPAPVQRDVETGVGPLPITPSRTQPGRSSTPNSFVQPVVTGPVAPSQSDNQIGGLLKSAGITSAVAAKAIQSGLIPVINAVGEIKMPKLSDLTDWIKNGWRVHPSAEAAFGASQADRGWYNPFKNYGNGITNAQANPLIDPTAQIQNAPANSYFDPVRSY